MPQALSSLEEVTPDWLTAVLRREGVLSSGRVLSLEQDEVDASSYVAHLTVSYPLEAPAGAPRHLVVKLAYPGLEQRMRQRNKREVALYAFLRERPAGLPVVRCYDAVYRTDETDRFHLLLDDPSRSSHRAYPHSAAPPTREQCEVIVDVLAEIHARCWQTRNFDDVFAGNGAREVHTGEWTEELGPWIDRIVPAFLEVMGERLSPERRSLYVRIAERLDARLRRREVDRVNLTLTHGDVHVGNFLYPTDPSGQPLVLDWKRAAMAPPTRDLAYMMALSWFPATRRAWETDLLRRYHGSLIDHGVSGYGWDDLWEDYRLSALKHLLEAVWGWSVRQNSAIWWNHLERITLAIDDLDAISVL
jgi:thiamine kinase-like enzyme